MAKNKPFQTIAEAIEAGEPLIADKITGELDSEKTSFFSLENAENYKFYYIERIFNTLSGRSVIIARPQTLEETSDEKKGYLAYQKRWKDEENNRIKTALYLPGYILIGWHFTQELCLTERGRAYYMPISGARYVFSKDIKTVWKKDARGAGYKIAEPEKHYNIKTRNYEEYGLSRWARKKIAEDIKQKPGEYFLTAPIWLLTSIPDPRPRYLNPEKEDEEETTDEPIISPLQAPEKKPP